MNVLLPSRLMVLQLQIFERQQTAVITTALISQTQARLIHSCCCSTLFCFIDVSFFFCFVPNSLFYYERFRARWFERQRERNYLFDWYSRLLLLAQGMMDWPRALHPARTTERYRDIVAREMLTSSLLGGKWRSSLGKRLSLFTWRRQAFDTTWR